MRSVPFLALLVAVVVVAGSGATRARATGSTTGVAVTYNLHYGSDPVQVLDVYRPSTPGTGRPLVVLVHGGSWDTGSKLDLNIVDVANTFVAAGMVVFSIDYRLVTPTIAGVPMQIQDVKLATWWAKAHAATYGASSTRVGLFGPSAGAGLAVLAGQQMNVQSAGAVKVVTSLSGFMDFSVLIPPGTIGQTQMAEYLGCLGTPCKLAVEQAGSPQYNVHPGCPAAHILHSASEHLPLVQAQNLVKAMKAAGCKTQLTVVPGALHGMKYWPTEKGVITSYFVANL